MVSSIRYSFLILCMLFLQAAAYAEENEISVIVNAKVEEQVLSLQELRAIFSMRLKTWPDGTPIKVYVLEGESDTHYRFCRNLLKVYPHQLQKGWDRLVYTGTGKAPTSVKDAERMRELVAQEPGAIGYMAAAFLDQVPESVNIRSIPLTK